MVFGKQNAPYDLDGDASLVHEFIVEGSQGESRSLRLAIVVAQLINLQLAKRTRILRTLPEIHLRSIIVVGIIAFVEPIFLTVILLRPR